MAFYSIPSLLSRITAVIFPNGNKQITAQAHQQLLKDVVDSMSAGLYNTARSYGAGASWCIHDAGEGYKIFRCTTNTTGSFNPEHWEAVADFTEQISELQATQVRESEWVEATPVQIANLDMNTIQLVEFIEGKVIVPIGFLVRYAFEGSEYNGAPLYIKTDDSDTNLAEFTIEGASERVQYIPTQYYSAPISNVIEGMSIVLASDDPPQGGEGSVFIKVFYKTTNLS